LPDQLYDTALFITALMETVAEFAYVKERGDYKKSFDIKNVTYGLFPVPTLEQQDSLSELAEQFVLYFASYCIFGGCVAELNQLVKALEDVQGFKVRKEFLNALRGSGCSADYNTSVAELLAVHRRAIDESGILSPVQVFNLAFHALEIAHQTNNIQVMAKPAFEWLNAKWTFVLDHQRFLLKCPAFHEKFITQVYITEGDSWIDKVIDLLQAILPTMGFNNESQLNHILNDMRKAKR
jgi:hypothetical protein